MKRKYNKDSVEFRMFQDYWAFIQEYAIAEDNQQFWDDVNDAGNKLSEKYKSKYFNALILAHIERLEKPSN